MLAPDAPSEREAAYQASGRELLGCISSDAEADRKSALAHHRNRRVAWRLGGALTGYFLMCCCLAVGLFPGLDGFAGFLVVTLVLAGTWAYSARQMTYVPYLLAPLSQNPELCRALIELTQRSPEVAHYVRSVNASGRQLRLFDIACANQIWEQAQVAHGAEADREVCRQLHSI